MSGGTTARSVASTSSAMQPSVTAAVSRLWRRRWTRFSKESERRRQKARSMEEHHEVLRTAGTGQFSPAPFVSIANVEIGGGAVLRWQNHKAAHVRARRRSLSPHYSSSP